METIQCVCPKCGAQKSVPADLEGRKGQCACGTTFSLTRPQTTESQKGPPPLLKDRPAPSRSSRIPVVTEYQSRRTGLIPKFSFAINCPHCKSDLTVSESEVSKPRDECPICGGTFSMAADAAQVVTDFYQEQQAKAAEEAAQKEARTKEAEARRQQMQQEEDDRQAKIASREQVRKEAEFRRIRDSSQWVDRYPNLAKYLEIVRSLITITCVVEALMIFVTGIAAATSQDAQYLTLVIWLLGSLLAWFQYVLSMASLEFVYVFLSIEQETIVSRKASQAILQHLTERDE